MTLSQAKVHHYFNSGLGRHTREEKHGTLDQRVYYTPWHDTESHKLLFYCSGYKYLILVLFRLRWKTDSSILWTVGGLRASYSAC